LVIGHARLRLAAIGSKINNDAHSFLI
jgi:hypothetical protein